jgi:2-dehydropantoate 2-reductase
LVNDAKNRRIIIYGAGAIGGTLGGHLALSGAEVILIGRTGHVNSINQKGLHFITPSGTHYLKVRAVTSPRQIDFKSNDAVFLCVKSQNTEEAMYDLHSVIPDVPVFCFQNGVRNEEIAARLFPRVYGVMVRIGGEYITDGEITVRRDPPGWVVIGRYPQGLDAELEIIGDRVRNAGFLVRLSSDVMPYKWGKLMTNLGNAIGAITNGRWEETRRINQAAMQEANIILAQANIPWVSQEKLSEEWHEIAEKPRKVLSTESQSSTWQSLARKQGSVETEFLNGEIVRQAKRLGKEAPINAALLQITQEMAAHHETPGKYTPGELEKLLGIT